MIPNARRDGFEETDSWVGIKRELVDALCKPLAERAYARSRAQQLDVKKLVSAIDYVVEQSRELAQAPGTTYDQIVDLMNSAKRLRRKTASALKLVGDLDDSADTTLESAAVQASRLRDAVKDVESVENQARMLVGRFASEDARIEGLKARLRQEIIRELLDIVKIYADQGTYQRIKRKLAEAS